MIKDIEKRKEYFKLYFKKYKDKKKKNDEKYRNSNKEEIKERGLKYRHTQNGRAHILIGRYRQADKKYNRGECTLTAEWVVENIFSKPCQYCGETDWTKIGCDRIDNLKSHTPDNVVPCCYSCNCKKGIKEYEKFIKT